MGCSDHSFSLGCRVYQKDKTATGGGNRFLHRLSIRQQRRRCRIYPEAKKEHCRFRPPNITQAEINRERPFPVWQSYWLNRTFPGSMLLDRMGIVSMGNPLVLERSDYIRMSVQWSHDTLFRFQLCDADCMASPGLPHCGNHRLLFRGNSLQCIIHSTVSQPFKAETS